MRKRELTGLLLILFFILIPLTPLKADEKSMPPGKILTHEDQKILEGEKKRKGDVYSSQGLCAYRSGNFNEAEGYFLKALALDPDNPSFNHYMGKTYMEMERYKEAEGYIGKAWMGDPDIHGLKYDKAYLYYKLGNLSDASELFEEIAQKETLNVLAHYYAGITLLEQKLYKRAQSYLIHAATESPSIKTKGSFYIGICYLKTGRIREAVERFQYVLDHAKPGPLREKAVKWIESAKRLEKDLQPYRIFLKMGYNYDKINREKLPDYNPIKEEDLSRAMIFFSSRYKIFNEPKNKLGVGFDLYIEEENIKGGIFNIYDKYRYNGYTFRIKYSPSYYWLDSESYLAVHQVKPEISRNINERLAAKISYSYYINNYFQIPGKDGHANEIFLDTLYNFKKGGKLLSCGIGFEENTASYQSHYYKQIITKLGFSMAIMQYWKLYIKCKYYNRRYTKTPPESEWARKDIKYFGSISLSRKILYEWLSITSEFNFTRNNSTFDIYDYKRWLAGLFINVNY